MRPTITLMGNKAREAIHKGINAIYEPVRRTLGPQGKNALLYGSYGRPPRITNDGVTVAETQEPKDAIVRLVSHSYREMCKRTNEKVGDGTTATTVIGGVLYNDSYKLYSENRTTIGKDSNIGVISLKRNIIKTAEKVKQAIKGSARKIETVEDLEKIAIVSVEDIEIGKTIAKMAWEVGVDGFIDVVEGYKGSIETEIIKGMRFPAKVTAKSFLNNPSRYEMVANDCQVIITNYALDNVKEAGEFINIFLKESPKLIVIAPSFSEQVTTDIFKAMFIVGSNGRPVRKQGFEIYPVKVPSLRTEQLEDLAIYCGAKFFDKQKGMKLKNARLEDAGFLEKLVVKDTEAKEDASAIGGYGMNISTGITVGDIEIQQQKSKVQERIDMLKEQLLETREEMYKKKIEHRIASMTSAVGIIKVGDSTRAESYYKKLKIEDSVNACKAALRGGYVKGGGICLKEIAETLPDDDIVKGCLKAPYEQIQSSIDGGLIIADDIIDPMEVIYYAVEHATQVVANLVTVDIITVEEEDINPSDAYLSIANAINQYTLGWKRKEGLIKENEIEMEQDKMASHEQAIADYEAS